MMTPVQATRMVFIQAGGSLGPAGTRTKYGPVTHLIQTYSCTARTAPPARAHAWTGLDEARSCACNDSGSIAWIEVFCFNAVGIVSPPSRERHDPPGRPRRIGLSYRERLLVNAIPMPHAFFHRFGSFQARSSGLMPPPNGVNCVIPSSSIVCA